MTRDETWLQHLLDTIWDNFFADVPQENDVKIVFGRRAKRRLGSISLDPKDRRISVITINALFKNPEIPQFVVEATIVHELTHYAHGFNSPLDRAQKHPHSGGVMKREFAERGLLELFLQQRRWLKLHWTEIVLREFANTTRKSAGRGKVKVPKPFWFIGE